jgi:hypothetical protein
MAKWGALIPAPDRDAFIEYLSTNFTPDKPAYVAGHSLASNTGR